MRQKTWTCAAQIAAVIGAAGCMTEFEEGAASGALLNTTYTFAESTSITNKEHCWLPAPHGANLDGRQVRIEGADGHVGLCTVDGESPDNRAYMNDLGLHKRLGRELGAGTGVTVSGVTVTDLCPAESSCSGIADPVTDLRDTYSITEIGPVINELELDTGSYSKVAYTNPHGRIETGTGQMIQAIYDEELERRGVVYEAYWAAGFRSGVYQDENGDTVDRDGYDHYHINSLDLSEQSFPGLGSLLGLTGIRQAVSFHGCSSSCPDVDVNIGGGIHESWRRGVADLLRGVAAQKQRDITVTATPPAAIAGSDPRNFVNRIAPRNRGLQIETGLDVRTSPDDRELVALTVKEAIDCVRENPDSYVSVDDSLTVIARDPGSAYYDGLGQCDGYGVQFSFSNTSDMTGVTFFAELSSSVACTSAVDGARVFANVYKQDQYGDWNRVGGGWRDVRYQGGACVYVDDAAFYEPVDEPVDGHSTYGHTRFRGVARAHDAAGEVLPARAVVSRP